MQNTLKREHTYKVSPYTHERLYFAYVYHMAIQLFVGGKMILPPHGKEFFHSTVSSFLHPAVSTFLHVR